MSDTKRNVMFSRKAGTSIGTYEQQLALVHTTSSKEAIELMNDPSLVKQYGEDTEKVLQLLLESTADLHERRHYLDTFGTIAGISMFATHMGSLKHFMGVCRQLRQNKQAWQLPLSRWVGQADCPVEIRRLRRCANADAVAADIFNGHFEREVAPGHVDDWWVDVPVGVPGAATPMNVPAFPVSMTIGVLEDGVLAAGGTNVTVYFPLGYEAILEGTAHSLARSFVDNFFPAVAKDFMVKYGPPLQIGHDLDESERMRRVRDHIQPYNITDLMISKALRMHGITQFSRSLVLKLSDMALSQGVLHVDHENDGYSVGRIDSPARALVDAIAEAQSEQLREDQLPYPDTIRARYEHLLARFKQGGDWDTVRGRHEYEAAVYVWESFLAHHVVIPLLEERLASDNALFYDDNQSLSRLFDRELPMVMVRDEQIAFQNIPDEVRTAWVRQMMQSEIARQVSSDAELILCPRAHRLLPGMKSLDLSGGNCDQHRRGGCGSWQPGRDNVLPNCIFTATLNIFGFIPIHPVEPEASTAVQASDPA